MAADRETLLAQGHAAGLNAGIMRRGVLRIEAELHRHDEYDALLAAAGGGDDHSRQYLEGDGTDGDHRGEGPRA